MKESSGTKEELREEIAELKKKIKKLEKSASLQKQTKTEQASKLQFRQIADDMPALICTFLPDSTLTYVNSAYCQLFSKRPDELVGRKFLDFLPDETTRKDVRHLFCSGYHNYNTFRYSPPPGRVRLSPMPSLLISKIVLNVQGYL
jgi:PAS domain S-box-containing protein